MSEHKHEKHQNKYVHCEFVTQCKDTFDAHRKENHKYSCDKCLLTSKDDWTNKIHICKVDINNPTFGDFYTKEWLDHNGCNAIYNIMKMSFGSIVINAGVKSFPVIGLHFTG